MPVAETTLSTIVPEATAARLRTLLAPHGRVRDSATGFSVSADIGEVHLARMPEAIRLRLHARDSAALAFMRSALSELMAEERWAVRWTGDTGEGQSAPNFRIARIVSAERLTRRMRRLVLEGDLARFRTGGLHLRVHISEDSDQPPPVPFLGNDGRLLWPADRAKPTGRVYTVRRIEPDGSRLTLDCVLHGNEYPGSRWARHARPGQHVGLTGPGGGEAPGAGCIVLAGDETALPAIARILEEIPRGTQATALIEVQDTGEEQPVRTQAQLDLHWLHRDTAPAGTTRLLEQALAALPVPPGDCSYWIACEGAAARRIRKQLLEQVRVSGKLVQASAYWHLGRAQKG